LVAYALRQENFFRNSLQTIEAMVKDHKREDREATQQLNALLATVTENQKYIVDRCEQMCRIQKETLDELKHLHEAVTQESRDSALRHKDLLMAINAARPKE